MGIVLVVVGAIMRFAISVHTKGFNIHTIGLILMLVGIVGLMASLFAWNSWGGFGRRDTYVEGGPRRRVIDEY